MFEMSKEDKNCYNFIMAGFISNLNTIDEIDGIKVKTINAKDINSLVVELNNSTITRSIIKYVSYVFSGEAAALPTKEENVVLIGEKYLSNKVMTDFIIGHELQHHYQGDVAKMKDYLVSGIKPDSSFTPDEVRCDIEGIKRTLNINGYQDREVFHDFANKIVEETFLTMEQIEDPLVQKFLVQLSKHKDAILNEQKDRMVIACDLSRCWY